jgi:hypothetical protein
MVGVDGDCREDDGDRQCTRSQRGRRIFRMRCAVLMFVLGRLHGALLHSLDAAEIGAPSDAPFSDDVANPV